MRLKLASERIGVGVFRALRVQCRHREDERRRDGEPQKQYTAKA
jgi:hypothetical protein